MAKENPQEWNLYQKLSAIQAELKAPKNLYNSFGKYSYRNAESICEALKPLEVKYGVATTISDTIQVIADRIYVTATVTIHDTTSDASLSVSASAREALDKKGMDEAQITGATSSYARKYALNGMFLLDDTKDVDSEEYQGQDQKEAPKTTKKAAPKKVEKPVEQKVEAPSEVTEAPKKRTVKDYPSWQKIVEICKTEGLDARQIAGMYKLTAQTPEAVFDEALIDLQESVEADKINRGEI